MKARNPLFISLVIAVLFIFGSAYVPFRHKATPTIDDAAPVKRYLYVAVPGIRDYLGYGGHGILVFDMDNNHRFVKRIVTKGFHPDNTPSNVKGVAVSVPLNSIYISTLESLQRIDLATDKLVWEKPFEGGCDRMAISPDGKTMYLPS
ncbi:MAG: YncE family protein, partial [Chitinophagaceae bacterium]